MTNLEEKLDQLFDHLKYMNAHQQQGSLATSESSRRGQVQPQLQTPTASYRTESPLLRCEPETIISSGLHS